MIIAIGVVLVAALLGYMYRAQLGSILNKPESPVVESRTELQIQEQLGELIKGGNFDDCKKIGNAYYETVCVNNVALQLAQERLDVSYCQKIDNKLVPIADCERKIIFTKSINKEDAAACDETKNEELRLQCRTELYLGLAFKKNDVSVCERETTPERRAECADRYIFQKEYVGKSTDFDCNRFLGDDMRQDCSMFATKKGLRRSEACLELQSNLFINHCMRQAIR